MSENRNVRRIGLTLSGPLNVAGAGGITLTAQSAYMSSGALRWQRANGSYRFLWPDDAGLWRTAIAAPEADGTPAQNSGTVVGDQSSQRADKLLERRWTRADQERALRLVLGARVYDFRYRDGRYNGERFSGIVTDEAPWLGKDGNRALNEVNAVGYLIGAIQAMDRRIAQLEGRRP